ncbi:THAP domain-containing protein 7 isoform X3 [Parasteatoda tepidariorum]|uniref:THAP domain-containing protein 7 isoform X3 n=1 Tax=Parasteatoda tepidariorum TaxID=114398 RepID=UPI001C71DA54|nr:uncharacterized protein LOC107443779 isoform X3 [Parasteatoda tepidariorum]
MTGCCAFGCTNNTKHGYKLYRLPVGARNEARRKIWLLRIGRANWDPNENSRLCEVHFTEDQFENRRADNRRLLKQTAIPTVFWHQLPPKPNKRSKCASFRNSNITKGQPVDFPLNAKIGQPSKNPSDPDYVPSVFDTSSKNTSPRKTSTTPPADDTESDKTTQVWTSLLQLQPITSEAGTSGLSEPSAQNQKPEEPEKPSTKAAVTGIWKSKTKPKPKPRPRKRPRTPSPPPAESKIIDPLKLCVVKMEIEDDGYNQNEEESFLASLTPSSSQTSHNDTLSFDSASSIKTEPNQEPTIYKLVPTISESAPTNSTQQDVEVFFKNVAQTVMQLPLHLIEETKTKVSALVYEMVIQAMREGSTNITQHKL